MYRALSRFLRQWHSVQHPRASIRVRDGLAEPGRHDRPCNERASKLPIWSEHVATRPWQIYHTHKKWVVGRLSIKFMFLFGGQSI